MKDFFFYIKLVLTQFLYTLFYQDRRVILLSFKNCAFKATMGEKTRETYVGLNQIFVKTLKEDVVQCVVNGEPATITYTFYGTLKVFSDQVVDKDHPYFNIDVKT